MYQPHTHEIVDIHAQHRNVVLALTCIEALKGVAQPFQVLQQQQFRTRLVVFMRCINVVLCHIAAVAFSHDRFPRYAQTLRPVFDLHAPHVKATRVRACVKHAHLIPLAQAVPWGPSSIISGLDCFRVGPRAVGDS
jgi:hypothetical protein